MNPNDSSVASAPTPGSNTSPVFRNGTAVAPDTHTARVNSAALLRASQEVGYTAVGTAAGHDKSWVCRFFSDEARVSRPELLAWLDAADLRITTPNAESAADAELLNALLRKTASVLAREAGAVGEGDVRLQDDEYKSLLLLAQRGVKAMQEAAL